MSSFWSPIVDRRTFGKRWLLLALAVLVGLTAVFWWQSPQLDGLPEENADSVVAGGASVVQKNVAGPIRQQPVAEDPKRKDSPAPLWRTIAPAALGALPPYEKNWSKEGRALVRMTTALEAARALDVGDMLTLSVPQLGEVRTSTIDEVSQGVGARSLLGLAEWADGRPQRWVVTVGPASLFAWIDTPAGPHELAIRDQYGWLLPSHNKMAGIDFSEPDYFVLDSGGRRLKPVRTL
ncbi:MAG: hypothetical protein OXJ53_02280 [Gammaproteobacteria bacterium]|nr:hypothetical protein [Gammaproteobacteria bacterium]MDE0273569.1 hypothetical protein [Gammaproteobacteria bacterium]